MNINELPDVSPEELAAAADELFESVHLSAPTNWRQNKELESEDSTFSDEASETGTVAAKR